MLAKLHPNRFMVKSSSRVWLKHVEADSAVTAQVLALGHELSQGSVRSKDPNQDLLKQRAKDSALGIVK